MDSSRPIGLITVGHPPHWRHEDRPVLVW